MRDVGHVEFPNSCLPQGLPCRFRDDGRWFTAGCVGGHPILRPRQIGVVVPESDILSCATYHSSIRLHTCRARQPVLHLFPTHKRAHKSLHFFLSSLHSTTTGLTSPRLPPSNSPVAALLLSSSTHQNYKKFSNYLHLRTHASAGVISKTRLTSQRTPRDWPRVSHTYKPYKTCTPRRTVPFVRF